MASAEGTVEIVVDIVGNFEDELQKLDKQLEKIDKKKISPDLDIDAEEEIKQIQTQLKQLEKNLDTILDIDVRGEGQAMATKALLSRDMHSTLHIDRDTSTGLPPPVEGALQASRSSAVRAAPDEAMMFRRSFNPLSFDGLIDRDQISPRQGLRNMGVPSGVGGIISARRRLLDGPDGDIDFPDIQGLNNIANNTLRRMLQRVNQLRPNMMQLWNIMAALIPIIVTMAAATVGLVAALAAVATAGVAILGLGLLGWGDSFSESIQNVKQEAMELGRTLFNVVQPAADVAQPVLMEWMQGAPRQIQKVVGPLKELIQAFDAPLGDMGAGIMDWAADVIEAMTMMRGEIVQIVMRLGRIGGRFLIEWLVNMIEFAHRNQQVLIDTARMFRLIFRWLLQLSIIAVRVLSVFRPFFEVLDAIIQLVSERWTAGFLAAIVTAITLTSVMTSLAATMQSIRSIGMMGYLAGFATRIWGVVTATWAWVAATNSLWAAMTRLLAVTVGGLLIGAASFAAGQAAMETVGRGSAGGGGPRRRAGGGNIIIQGDIRQREMDRLMDEMPRQAQSEDNIRSMREQP